MRATIGGWLIIGIMLSLGCTAHPSQAPVTTPATTPATTPGTAPGGASIRYVALGDSYTIGTSVPASERWPEELVRRLGDDLDFELVANLAINGYTSADLIADQLPDLDALQPGFVSLQIGVNDVVQGVPREQYRANVERILGDLLARLPNDRIVVISTPDYTRTPRGADFGDRDQQRAAIDEVNEIMADEAAARGIAFVDIGAVADRAGGEPALVAGDGLHPSGAQYREWVGLIEPAVRALLSH